MDVWVGNDARQFAARAEGFLAERLERNVLATTLGGVLGGRYESAIFAVGLNESGVTVAVAMRTPPSRLLAAGFEDPGGAADLIAAWLALDPQPPGVAAEPDTAGAVAAAWIDASGGQQRIDLLETIQVLDRVIPPPSAPPGHLRMATIKDQAQLEDWAAAFAIETGLAQVEAMGRLVSTRIESGQLHVWDRGGTNAAMVGHSDPVGATARIGPVFTPPELRGQGYAAAATAAVSRMLLDGGAARCMLFADAANAAANQVYAKIGYTRCGEWQERAFLADADA